MKVFLLLCATLSALTPSTFGQGDELYSRRYDSLDVNTIFRSSRLMNNYVDCLLDKKPCPPEGKDLKRVLPDALRTRCRSCTRLQKSKALDVITRLYYNHPSIYTALAERYDPTGEYTRNFENWFDEQNGLKQRPPLLQGQERDEVPDNVQISRVSTTQEAPLSTEAVNSVSSTQQAVRRSPSLSDAQDNPNELQTERTRIPSSWITSTTRAPPTQRPITTRQPLRTSQTPIRLSTRRDPPVIVRSPPVTSRPQIQPSFQIDSIFAPRPNGPITRSINKLLDTTEKVVNGFAGMFKSTFEIITGTG